MENEGFISRYVHDAPPLDERDLQSLVPVGRREYFEAGSYVLRCGDADVDLILVESGRVEVLNPMNGDSRIAIRGPNEVVGDIDLLTRRPIVFTARSLGDEDGGPTRILRVPSDKVRQLLNSAPGISEKLISTFQVRRQLLEGAGILGVRIIGPATCKRTNQLREFLHKNFVPSTWVDPQSECGRKIRAPFRGPMPIVDWGGGRALFDPSLKELAVATGVWRDSFMREVDLAIVGAGPCGIAAGVYAASEGLRTVVLERLGPGGQIGSSSRIENFLGFPAGVTGCDLAMRGVLQMMKFGAEIVAPVTVERMTCASARDGYHQLHLDTGDVIRARTVFACTGVNWRRLQVSEAERFERISVHYACTVVEARLHERSHVAVVGGGNSAGQAVVFLAERRPERTVHVFVRRTLCASMSKYLVDRIRRASNVIVHEGFEVTSLGGAPQVEWAELANRATGERKTIPLSALFVFIGADPGADWLPGDVARDRHGFVLTGSDVVAANRWPRAERSPCSLETSVPGVLAGGDLRAGSTKRVAFAIGDGSLAVTSAHTLRALAAA